MHSKLVNKTQVWSHMGHSGENPGLESGVFFGLLAGVFSLGIK